MRFAHATLALAAVTLTASGAAAANQGGAPAPLDVNVEFAAGEVCAFPVSMVFDGKLKVMSFSGDRTTAVWPGLRATFTNLADHGKSVTLRGSGTFHDTVQPDGSVLSVNTGHVYLIGGRFGASLYIGNFTTTLPAGGDYTDPVGHFRLIDVCGMIE